MFNPSIKKILPSTPAQNVTYSYNDIAAGTGIQVFYVAEATDINILSTSAVYSNEIVNDVHIDGLLVATKKIDADYDVVFSTPRTIKGMSYVSVPVGIRAVTAGKVSGVYIIAKVRKVSGGTESEIANNQSDTYEVTGTKTDGKSLLIDIDIPITTFKAGDSLRLTLELWAINDAATDAYAGIGTDPQDRNDNHTDIIIPDTVTTKCEFYCPFKLDI